MGEVGQCRGGLGHRARPRPDPAGVELGVGLGGEALAAHRLVRGRDRLARCVPCRVGGHGREVGRNDGVGCGQVGRLADQEVRATDRGGGVGERERHALKGADRLAELPALRDVVHGVGQQGVGRTDQRRRGRQPAPGDPGDRIRLRRCGGRSELVHVVGELSASGPDRVAGLDETDSGAVAHRDVRESGGGQRSVNAVGDVGTAEQGQRWDRRHERGRGQGRAELAGSPDQQLGLAAQVPEAELDERCGQLGVGAVAVLGGTHPGGVGVLGQDAAQSGGQLLGVVAPAVVDHGTVLRV